MVVGSRRRRRAWSRLRRLEAVLAAAGYVPGYVGYASALFGRLGTTADLSARPDTNRTIEHLPSHVTPGQRRSPPDVSAGGLLSRLTWGFVELMGLEPTTSCLQSSRGRLRSTWSKYERPGQSVDPVPARTVLWPPVAVLSRSFRGVPGPITGTRRGGRRYLPDAGVPVHLPRVGERVPRPGLPSGDIAIRMQACRTC